MKVFVDWGKITAPEDFYLQVLPQVEAPEWHGENLDALADSLVAGSINGIEPPFCVINLNVGSLKEDLRDFFSRVKEIYEEASSVGRKIRVFSE